MVVIAALALAVVSSGAGQPRQASQSQSLRATQPQWILFTARPPGLGAEQVYRITPAGKGLKQLTRGAFAAAAPAFSPDGKRIAFARLGAGIFSMNLDGTGARRLTSNGRDGSPTWSPDGKQIAFVRPSGTGWGVYVMSAAGAAERQLRKAPPPGRPSWTSHGLLIPTEGDLARVDPRTGSIQKLFGATIDALVGTAATSVSPDLATITFVGAGPQDPGDKDCGDGIPCPRFALYIEDLGKHKPPRILQRDAGPASFSPDGKSLAFVTTHNRLVLWRLANGTSTVIKTGTVHPTVSSPPAWQPR